MQNEKDIKIYYFNHGDGGAAYERGGMFYHSGGEKYIHAESQIELFP